MKNKKTLLAIRAILAVALVLGMTACGGVGGGGVNGTAPTVTTMFLPNGEVGTAYSQTLTAAGDTPIIWSIDTGALPNGLTLNASTGVISGMPSAAGAFNFIVKAANAAGSGTKQLSITIALTGGGTPTPPPAEGFYNIAGFKTWLDAQPNNTATTPYNVKVNVDNLGGTYITSGSLGNALRDPNYNKYINLDLSGSTITSIEYNAFLGSSSLTGITIPNSVTSIGNNAFSSCSNLTDVTIPENVTSIGNNAFYYCTSLTSVTIPSGVTSIERAAFSGCTSLTAINVAAANTAYTAENGVLYSKDRTTLVAYPRGKSAASFIIPDSVTTIESLAFFYCTSLTSVTIPSGVTTIGNMAFRLCTSLTGVTIPNSVTSIGGYAFAGCDNLTSVTIPNSVTTILEGTFVNCRRFTSIIIPNSVTSIGEGAFASCTSLTSVTFQNTIDARWFDTSAFGLIQGSLSFGYIGDLRAKYLAGGIGTYTRPNGESKTWTKK